MNVFTAFLALSAPFALAALLSWVGQRNSAARRGLLSEFDDVDGYRVQHDADAARTRFTHNPAWPASGVTGERR